MNDPLISIVIPAYNYARFLRVCIDGILSQSYPHWELIVVDNGSTDDTPAVLSGYVDPRIRKLKIDVNEGPVKAWAMGYKIARGDYFALLPADDVFTPNKLLRQVEYLRAHPEVHCVATYIDVIDDAGQRNHEHWMIGWINRPVDYTDLKQWRWKHHFCIPTAIYQKSICDLAGGIPLDGLTNICDWDFHVRLLGAGAKFAVIPEPLTLYRWHQSNTSKQRQDAHNQWIYSHTRSLLPALRHLSPNYYREVGQCIEALYLDPYPNYFLEEVPALWRCAHLEALLNPAGGLAEFPNYRDFQRYTEAWRVDSENRAAITALDNILMTLRATLLSSTLAKCEAVEDDRVFPLEQQLRKKEQEIADMLQSPVTRIAHTIGRVRREMGRAYQKLRRRIGGSQAVNHR